MLGASKIFIRALAMFVELNVSTYKMWYGTFATASVMISTSASLIFYFQ